MAFFCLFGFEDRITDSILITVQDVKDHRGKKKDFVFGSGFAGIMCRHIIIFQQAKPAQLQTDFVTARNGIKSWHLFQFTVFTSTIEIFILGTIIDSRGSYLFSQFPHDILLEFEISNFHPFTQFNSNHNDFILIFC